MKEVSVNHFKTACVISNCDRKCHSRHPKPCRNGESCSFFLSQICAFKQFVPVTCVKDDKEMKKYEKEVEDLKVEIFIPKNDVKMKENNFVKENQVVLNLQSEVKNLKAMNEKYENKIKVLNHEILAQKSKDFEEQIFDCDLCNHKFNKQVDLTNHIIANHASMGKMDDNLPHKLEELEIKNDELAESNNIYEVELEIKEEIKLKSRKIYTERIHRRAIEYKHHCNFCSFKGKSDNGLRVHVEKKHNEQKGCAKCDPLDCLVKINKGASNVSLLLNLKIIVKNAIKILKTLMLLSIILNSSM
jgi:hypothetical protein